MHLSQEFFDALDNYGPPPTNLDYASLMQKLNENKTLEHENKELESKNNRLKLSQENQRRVITAAFEEVELEMSRYDNSAIALQLSENEMSVSIKKLLGIVEQQAS